MNQAIYQRRSGFTLVEVLVCLFIIGILLGLLLPAVQMARESARKVQCQSQLKQIVFACHQYHDLNGHLPAGHISGMKPKMENASFLVFVLPFIERQPQFDNIIVSFSEHSNGLEWGYHPDISSPVPLFGCPSDGRTPGPQVWAGHEISLTSYLGNLGKDRFSQDGLLMANSRVRFAEITDGLSSTVILGERPPSGDFSLGWWYAGAGLDSRGTCEMILGHAEISSGLSYGCGNETERFRKGNIQDSCDDFHYWSLHPGGAYFALADGSVRFIGYDGADFLPKYATRAGSEVAFAE